jgi:hypothetical protein
MPTNLRPELDAAAAYIVVLEAQRYRLYRSFVGPEYASLAGFAIWKRQYYPLLRQQPRVNAARGWLLVLTGLVLFALGYIPHLALLFIPLALITLAVALTQFRHQALSAADQRALYEWHKAYAVGHGAPPFTYQEARRNT